LDSASEQTQPEEKKEEDFFTSSLSADNSNNSDEADYFKAQTPEVSFGALMVEMKYFFVILFRKALGYNTFPIHSCFQKCTPSHTSSFSCQQTCYYFMFASLVLYLSLLHYSTCLVLVVHIIQFINLIPSIHFPQLSLDLTVLFSQQF
jgi:hypothetical protein